MPKSKIDWTDYVFNPVSGCTKVSEGCKFCYADRFSKRTLKPFNQPGRKFTDIVFHDEAFEKLNTYKDGSKVFVGSVTDIFHPDIPDSFLEKLWNVFLLHSGSSLMQKLNKKKLIFQILTKRPERMKEFCQSFAPLPNVWLGVSAENQQRLNERLPILMQTRAAVRFVSLEPLLGRINLFDPILKLQPKKSTEPLDIPIPSELFRPDWIIIGGESGPKARECNLFWLIDLVDMSKFMNIPVFVKQLGSFPIYDGTREYMGVKIIIDKAGLGYKGNNFENFPDQLKYRELPDAKI